MNWSGSNQGSLSQAASAISSPTSLIFLSSCRWDTLIPHYVCIYVGGAGFLPPTYTYTVYILYIYILYNIYTYYIIYIYMYIYIYILLHIYIYMYYIYIYVLYIYLYYIYNICIIYICYPPPPQRSTIFSFLLMQKQSRYTITFKKDEHILRSESTTFLEGSYLF